VIVGVQEFPDAKGISPVPLAGNPNAVPIPVPKPEIPEIESPVQLVKLPLAGVPSAGLAKVGELEPTKLPVPDCPDNPLLTALFVVITNP
jgi:hypothetical protein